LLLAPPAINPTTTAATTAATTATTATAAPFGARELLLVLLPSKVVEHQNLDVPHGT
jgi:hypothetical protein